MACKLLPTLAAIQPSLTPEVLFMYVNTQICSHQRAGKHIQRTDMNE